MSDSGLADVWQELSTFYKSLLKAVTYSEIDRPARGPIVYANDCPLNEENYSEDEDEEELNEEIDFVPLIFQSLFYICTRTGWIILNHLFLL